jgi:hypothetical protein
MLSIKYVVGETPMVVSIDEYNRVQYPSTQRVIPLRLFSKSEKKYFWSTQNPKYHDHQTTQVQSR